MRRLLKRLMAAGDKHTTPRSALTLSTVVVFVLFLILLSVAVRFAIKSLWVALIIIGTCASLFLLIAAFLEYHWRGNREYVSGRGYTILVISLAIPAFTGLYSKSWYTQLRNNVLVTSTDSVASVRFPSIAILQREDWTSQGTLLTGGSKCYLVWYNDNAPNCASLDPSTLGNSTMCTCKEFWYNSDEVIENFTWMNTRYRYKVFDPPSWFIDNNPTYLLLLQTFFNYNATKARDESSTTNPSLLLAVYDPTLGMQKSFDLGYTRMNLVNANGILAVNIGLHVRDDGNGISDYDYQLSLVSSPAIDLVCDMSSPGDYKYPCHLTLFIQIPNFQRTITVTKSAMTWVDAASAAGGFLSFLQFLSWIISAQAWLGH